MYFKGKLLKLSLLFFLGTVLYSCSSALYEPDLKIIKDEALYSELKEGRMNYVQKCGNCHNLYLPEKYTKSEWVQWLGKMEKKAKLSEKEKSSIFKYLTFK
jgi:hypothetical protein